MVDLLIRDVPADVIAAIDAHARRLGLSRSEYLRRTLAREVGAWHAEVSVDDLKRFTEIFADLGDPEMMGRAWE